MVCKFCGNEIDDGSDFCYICGQKIEQQEASSDTGEIYVPTQQSESADQPAAEAVQASTATEQAAEPAAPAPAPAPAPAVPEQAAGKKKKSKKVKDPNVAGRATRFFSFLIPLIGLLVYSRTKKKGNIARANSVLNATMRGLCIYMAIVVVVLIKRYVM